MRGNPGAEEPEMDSVTADEVLDVVEPPAAVQPAAARPVTDDRKWPLATRVVFIAGSAAALWGLVWLGYRAI
jgi:hypothetical protein